MESKLSMPDFKRHNSSLEESQKPSLVDELEVGSFYEINHKLLPPNTPIQIKSTRVAVVTKKDELNITVGFPNILSLGVFFTQPQLKFPKVDEEFTMEAKFAKEILHRIIPFTEIEEKGLDLDFWLLYSTIDILSNMFNTPTVASSSSSLVKEKTRKRKQEVARYEELLPGQWSNASVKNAEETLVKIMKKKGAVVGSPMLGRTLRSKAIKHIGDIGLVDLLLRRMNGTIAPNGEYRFQEGYNADHAMEYWLESADLVVKKPFWNPPPALNPGDSLPKGFTTCVEELKVVKKEIAHLKWDIMLLKIEQDKGDKEIVPFTNYSSENSEGYKSLMKRMAELEQVVFQKNDQKRTSDEKGAELEQAATNTAIPVEKDKDKMAAMKGEETKAEERADKRARIGLWRTTNSNVLKIPVSPSYDQGDNKVAHSEGYEPRLDAMGYSSSSTEAGTCQRKQQQQDADFGRT